jgi:hypothetical protein
LGCRGENDKKGEYWLTYDVSTHKYEDSTCRQWKGMCGYLKRMMQISTVEENWCTLNNDKTVFRVPHVKAKIVPEEMGCTTFLLKQSTRGRMSIGSNIFTKRGKIGLWSGACRDTEY